MPLQARTEFAAAINQIASEKGVEVDVIIDAIKQAALAAYRKDLSFRNEPIPDDFEDLGVKLDPGTGEISIYREDKDITPPGFARIAAQTAKQVIAQKLHEAEKGAIMEEYDQKIGTIVSGAIQRQEGNTYFVDLGRAEGILPPSEQVRDEYYGQNQRMKFYIKEIRETGRGPEVIVSRTDPGLVKGLFAMEVPEIQSGIVEIKEIAREAGGRTKVAVTSNQDGVDPVGSLVGQKGVRVQAVINELGEEKIDIILYSDDAERFIASALSPAKDIQVELNQEEKVAKVKISDSQLSLAIGKGGQNVRLAAKLTGWKIDIEGTGEGLEEETQKKDSEEPEEKDTHKSDQSGDPLADDRDDSIGEKADSGQSQNDAEGEAESVDGVVDEEKFEKAEEEKLEEERQEEAKESEEESKGSEESEEEEIKDTDQPADKKEDESSEETSDENKE